MRLCTTSVSGTNTVSLCAPSWVASYNIKGKTIHNALKLPVQHGWNTTYLELGVVSFKKLKRDFYHIHTILIDEVS